MAQKTPTKGFKSLTLTLILFVFAFLFITALSLGGTGIIFLNKALHQAEHAYENAFNNGYKTEIKSQVQSAIAILEGFYNQAKSGAISEDEAKKQAMETIRNMRYRDDGSGYMWIDDTDYNLVMHPILPDQEGSNRYELKDQNGVMITQNIIASAQAGGGYNEFYFTKADGVTVAPKIAYSEMFEPWQWVVTTGNYIDDMQAEMKSTEKSLEQSFFGMIVIFIVLGILLIMAGTLFSALFGKRIVTAIKRVETKLNLVADGNLAFSVEPELLKRADELGKIASLLEHVKASLSGMIQNVKNSSSELRTDSEHFSEQFNEISNTIEAISTTMEELAEGATNQANETELVSKKITELGHVIETEKNDVSGLEQSVSSMRDHSDDAIKNIDSLYKIAELTNNGISKLYDQTQKNNESMTNITAAIEVIKDITEQTNLLSLNANIEAARAGEAGKGFAVVAEEIRKLADNSAESAMEIENIIQSLIQNVQTSVEEMEIVSKEAAEQQKKLKDTQNSFKLLFQEIKKVENAASEIGSQTTILTELKEVVANAATGLANVVQENAAATQETSASLEQLSETIEICRQETDNLVVLSNKQAEEADKFQL